MPNYKLTDSGVLRLTDGAHIPNDPGNRDWREYQDWLAEGNMPNPADPPPGPTPAETAKEIMRARAEQSAVTVKDLKDIGVL